MDQSNNNSTARTVVVGGIIAIGLLYAFLKKQLNVKVLQTVTKDNGERGISFQACNGTDCITDTFFPSDLVQITPLQNGYFVVAQARPLFNEITIGIGRQGIEGGITADYMKTITL